MKQLLFLASITMLLVSCGTIEKHNKAVTSLHSVENLHSDIDKLYKQLQHLHPRLYQYNSKEVLDFKFDSLKRAINQPMTSRSFHKALAQVTKYVGQGHMSVSPPFKTYKRKERIARLAAKFDVNNLDFEYVENKIIVRQARGSDSLLQHAELLKVNGQNAMDLHRQFKKTVASDGYNTTFHNRVVGYRFLSYYQQANGIFDSISLTFRNTDSTFIKSYKRIFKTEKDDLEADSILKHKPKDTLTKAQRKAKKLANRIKWKQKRNENRKRGFDYKTKTYAKTLSFVGNDSAVALLTINSFSKGSKYKDFYEETFRTLKAKGTKNLVIDLRNNFGGRLKEIRILYTYLTDKKFTLINKSETNTRLPTLKSAMSNSTSLTTKLLVGLLSPILIPSDVLKTSKKEGQLYYRYRSAKAQEPNPLNFKGDVYVLINGNSFSASSVISTQLKGDNRAVFVGEETGGAYNGTVAGQYKIYTLPNTKVRARIGLMHIDAKHKTTPDGYGIKPDVIITPKYQDRLNDRDPELEWVLNRIKQNG